MTSDYMMLCEARTCYSTINPYWGLAKPSLLRSRPGGGVGSFMCVVGYHVDLPK